MRRTSLVLMFPTLLLTLASARAADGRVDELVKALANSDKEVCLKAADALGELGAGAKAAVPALIQALGRADKDVRWHAARALGAIGADSSQAVPALTAALSDGDASVRGYAAFALGRIGKAALPAVDQLIKNAFDQEPLVRRASLRALRAIDPPQQKVMPLVLDILDKGEISIIAPALETLAKEGKVVVPRLCRALEQEKARYWACIVLAEIGPDAADAVPDLTKVLGDDNPDVRLQALMALGEIGQASQAAVPTILTLFEKDSFPQVRYGAAYALGKIKAKGDAEAALRRAMDGQDEFLRTISAWALARTNPSDKELVKRAITLLVDAFKSKDVHVRRAAARAVVEFELDPEIASPVLVDALKDKDPAVVANATEALAAMGPKALRNVDAGLKNKDLRHYALLLIARLGPKAEEAVPSLVAVLKQAPKTDEDAEFVREAQFALASIGPAAASAVPTLIKSLSSNRDEICASAAFALGKIGPGARSAVPYLRNNLKSQDAVVKLASVLALLEIQPGERKLAIVAAPLLSQALDSDKEMIRAEAATAVGKLGDLGKREVPRLKKLLKDDSELVRRAAADALKKLGS